MSTICWKKLKSIKNLIKNSNKTEKTTKNAPKEGIKDENLFLNNNVSVLIPDFWKNFENFRVAITTITQILNVPKIYWQL